jgi:septin 7
MTFSKQIIMTFSKQIIVENMDHCDFLALRNLLIRSYMLDLLDTTNNVHYENYRCRKLTGIGPENKKATRDGNK